MYPTQNDIVEKLGRDAERLLREITTWVTRRKETFTLQDDKIVRRAMSVDYELPSWVAVHERPDGADSDELEKHGVCYAPLFFLQKGSDDLPQPGPTLEIPPAHFAGFNLRNDAGRAMSLPPRSWNAQVSLQAMWCALEDAARKHNIALTEDTKRYALDALANVATSERNEAVQLLGELRQPKTAGSELAPVHHALLASNQFAWLVAACAVASIAMVPLVGRAARRGIVKLEYLQEIEFVPTWKVLTPAAGFKGYDIWLDAPFVGACTYHVEIPAPDGMEILDAALIKVEEYGANLDPSDHAITLHRSSGFTKQVHLYVDEAGDQHGALAWVRLRTRRREFVLGATSLAFVISAVLWASYALQESVRSAPTGTSALLLLFPSVAATYAARAGRNAMSSRALFVARGLLMLASLMPYTAAAVIALSPREQGAITGSAFECWLLVLATSTTICAMFLLASSLLPQPLGRWQRIASPRFHERRRGKPDDWQPWFARPTDCKMRRWVSKRLTGRNPGRP